MKAEQSFDVASWLTAFSTALAAGDNEAAADLFSEGGFWRDFLAFGGTLATYEGRQAISEMVIASSISAGASQWSAEAPAGATEGFIGFKTNLGIGRGYVRLAEGRALALFTMLHDLVDHPLPVGARRMSGVIDDAAGQNWQDLRVEEMSTLGVTVDPYILIVGAGQAGLALGATLRLLNVPTLLIDKHARVGDQWRSRYKSLTLHDPVWYDHMPFLPFPEHWPVYTPKDKMGDWLELYAKAMELDPWMSTELLSANYDPAESRWHARIRRGDEIIDVHPAHLILAVGNAGFPNVPQFDGHDVFGGTQYHSSAHTGGEGLTGKKVVVIGANNSAHDICADLVTHGAQVTMVQRSSTHIVRQSTMTGMLLKGLYSEEALAQGITTDMADMLAASLPIRLQEATYRQAWDMIRELEAPYYAKLEAAGFKLDFAEDGTGIGCKYQRSASGYYIDVGASEMIADGRIALKSGVEVTRLTATGVAFEDGTHLPADMIIYATGFGSMEQWVSRLIGPEVAEKVGKCWGYGSGFKGDPGPWEGELRNMWKPTAQDGLWFMGGNLAQARFYSRILGLQLKARHAGLSMPVYRPDAG